MVIFHRLNYQRVSGWYDMSHDKIYTVFLHELTNRMVRSGSPWVDAPAPVLGCGNNTCYPLVNIYMPMEKIHRFFNGKTHYFNGHFQNKGWYMVLKEYFGTEEGPLKKEHGRNCLDHVGGEYLHGSMAQLICAREVDFNPDPALTSGNISPSITWLGNSQQAAWLPSHPSH